MTDDIPLTILVIALILGILLLPTRKIEAKREKTKVEKLKTEKIIPSKLKLEQAVGRKKLNSIIKCESQFNPRAKNKHSSARGLFQITDSSKKVCEKVLGRNINRYNVKDSYDCAWVLYQHGGLAHWSASQRCWGG